MVSDRTTERRSEPRPRALKGARLIFNHRASVINCTVRNLSSKGAKLIVESQVGIPNSFDLEFDEGTTRPCRVIWRREGEIGVHFEAP